jgi:hypothetical protein
VWRFLFIAFLIAHGGIHVAIWATPKPKDPPPPFDPSHSWVLGDRRGVALVLALVAGVALVAAGIGLWASAEWWRPVAVAGLAVSFGLMGPVLHPVVPVDSGRQRRPDRGSRVAGLAIPGDGGCVRAER